MFAYVLYMFWFSVKPEFGYTEFDDSAVSDDPMPLANLIRDSSHLSPMLLRLRRFRSIRL